MAVISVSFMAFCIAVFFAYFVLPKVLRPYLLLVASLFFYASFGFESFAFIGASIVSTFACAHITSALKKKGRDRWAKFALCITVIINMGILTAVKYLNYSLSLFGMLLDKNAPSVSLIVPIGVAFYSMQAVSYCVDVFRGKYAPERNIFKYTLYMTFFPIILQGPISRYDQLAHQLFLPHSFSYKRAKSGILLVMFGLFKKIVIADRAALLVNQVFGDYGDYQGIEIIIAALMYTVQIYTDFSGCVDISRGISEVLGITLIDNFDHPYFSVSIKDFWRRWHKSLSAWFKDYIYIPLGGSRKGKIRKYVNLTVVFFVSGLWHGVGLHYVVWGLLQAFYQIFGELTEGVRHWIYDKCSVDRNSFSYRFGQRLITFVLVNISWVVFRADGCVAAWKMLKSAVTVYNPWVLADGSILKLGLDGKDWNVMIFSLAVLLIVSLLQGKIHIRETLEKQTFWFRYSVYLLAIIGLLVFGIYGPGFDAAQFLYMQF